MPNGAPAEIEVKFTGIQPVPLLLREAEVVAAVKLLAEPNPWPPAAVLVQLTVAVEEAWA